MQFSFNILLRTTFGMLASVGVLFYSTSAIAAERVVFRFGVLRSSLSVEELTKFAETGVATPALKFYLSRANQEPQAIRNVLNQEVNASPVTLDRTLNHPIGEFLLDRIGQTISTSSGQANRQALRSALVLSANKDNKVSLIEIIQNYPTSEVHVEGASLVRTVNQISLLTKGVQSILRIPENFN